MQEITNKDYSPDGTTALLDAMGSTILSMKKRTRKKDKVLFVINTDGEENASREFTNEDVKKLIKECEAKRNWKFIFIGANIDSFAIGGNLGVQLDSVANYSANAVGQASVYNAVSLTTTQYRASTDGSLDTKHLKSIK